MAQKAFLIASCLIVALVGCSGEPHSGKPTDAQATVTGSVTKGGKPIALDSSVTFICAERNATAAGKVDALGKFSLEPGLKNVGIPAGRYKVTVRPPDKKVEAGQNDDYKKMMAGGGTSTTAAPAASGEIPAKLMTADKTTLVLEVKAGANNFDIDLDKLQ